MAHLNEYSKYDLQVLQLAVAIAFSEAHRHKYMRYKMKRLKKWAAEIKEALHDIEVEEKSLNF